MKYKLFIVHPKKKNWILLIEINSSKIANHKKALKYDLKQRSKQVFVKKKFLLTIQL